MKREAKTARVVSEATRRKQSEKKTKSHAKQREAVINAIRIMVAVIATEASENQGEYPGNNGLISRAEIAKRAGIHPATLYNKGYELINSQINTWVESLDKKVESQAQDYSGRRLSLADRYNQLKVDFDAIEDHNLILETDLLLATTQLEDANKQIAELNSKLERLYGGRD